jgi:hypothetical protein
MLSVFVVKSAHRHCVKISGLGKILVQGQWGDYQQSDGKGKAICQKIIFIGNFVSSRSISS